jgi:Haemolymph juvenile hormone binding protein (JHBP)
LNIVEFSWPIELTFWSLCRSSVHFTNLFNGDKALAENMNLFLNQNGKLLLEELKKPINSSFARIYKDLLNSVFRKIPYNELFIE